MSKYVKKSKLNILRGKLTRMGFKSPIRDDMPERVADSFIAEMRMCPDCAAAAAKNWKPRRQAGPEELLAKFDGGEAPIN